MKEEGQDDVEFTHGWPEEYKIRAKLIKKLVNYKHIFEDLNIHRQMQFFSIKCQTARSKTSRSKCGFQFLP